MSPPPPARLSLWIGLAALVGLAVRLATFTGTIVSDDLSHAYAGFHFFDDPIEYDMPHDGASAYTVNARRIGVNLPLWAATRLLGVSEASLAAVPLGFSLLGIFAICAWVWALCGPRAGVIAAWLWALLPVDVWHATVFLQDNVFATVLTAGLAAMAWGERTGRKELWMLSGFALGYLQYVKENAVVLLALALAIGAIRSVRARRLHRETLWLLLGVAVAQLLALGYFAWTTGDPFHYVREWLHRQVSLEGEAAPRPFPMNVVRFLQYVFWNGALGFGVPVAAVMGARLLRKQPSLSPALRVQLVVVTLIQFAILFHILRWGAWTMRYLLQITPALVALAAIGLHRARPRWLAIAGFATAAGLVLGHPQHGRFRGQVARAGFAAIEREIPPDVPVYVVAHPERAAHYTDRAFAMLAGYRPRPGGWHVTRDPESITRGVIVWTSYERLSERPLDPPGRRLFGAATQDGRIWMEVFAVGR